MDDPVFPEATMSPGAAELERMGLVVAPQRNDW